MPPSLEQLSREGRAGPDSLRGLRIVVVDDEADVRELLSEVLASWGAEVRIAANAGGARDLLAAQTPDVLISDIGMPDEDGYSLIRSIRHSASIETSRVPAIAVTAFGAPADRARALAEGFNVHMTKPVPPRVLADAVLKMVASAA